MAAASRPPSTRRPAGSLVIVEPGTYNEMVILYKNIRLQGAGAGVTNINAFKVPAEKLQTWRQKIEDLRVAGSISLLDGQATGLNTFATEYGPGIIVLGTANMAMNSARIDGFRISGADQGGAIFVNGYTNNFLISNNRIRGNEGFYGGGIRVGHPELIFQAAGGEQEYVDAQNNNLIDPEQPHLAERRAAGRGRRRLHPHRRQRLRRAQQLHRRQLHGRGRRRHRPSGAERRRHRGQHHPLQPVLQPGDAHRRRRQCSSPGCRRSTRRSIRSARAPER